MLLYRLNETEEWTFCHLVQYRSDDLAKRRRILTAPSGSGDNWLQTHQDMSVGVAHHNGNAWLSGRYNPWMIGREDEWMLTCSTRESYRVNGRDYVKKKKKGCSARVLARACPCTHAHTHTHTRSYTTTLPSYRQELATMANHGMDATSHVLLLISL